jgi:hypothetical protein
MPWIARSLSQIYLGLSDELTQATKPDPTDASSTLVENYDYNPSGQSFAPR